MKLVALAVLIALPCLADDASRTKKAEEYLKLAQVDRSMQQMLGMIVQQMKSGMIQQLTGMKIPPEMEKPMAEFQDKVGAMIAGAMSWDKLQPQYVKLLADAYTDEELDDIIAFYRSKSGQSMVSKAPQLMTKGAEIAQGQIATVTPELQKLMKEFMAEVAGKAK
jgi:hypothetical protein